MSEKNTTGGNTGGTANPNHPMSKSDSERIQSTQAKGGSDMSSGGFAARAQSAADKNVNNNAAGNKLNK